MENSPIAKFKKWFDEEMNMTKVSVPTACCLSTVGIDNFPNARFVSFKGIVKNNFVVTGTLTSRKGLEINENRKAAITFWWTETERQVRIQGNAILLSDDLADKYFAERSRDSQIVSIVSDQGKTLKDIKILNKKYQDLKTKFKNQNLTRPSNWGGYLIEPIRIEFLEFKSTRFHTRKLYQQIEGEWTNRDLLP